MIITKLEGGHSNQLFQYAAARRLSNHLGVELFIDKWWFENVVNVDSPRFYELGGYNFPQRFINRSEFALVEDKPENLKAKLYKLTKGRAKPRIRHVRQRDNGFNKEVLALSDNVYLDGWWQSEKYFKDIRSILLKEIEPKTKPNVKNAKWLNQIQNSNSVSLHVRRGDYVENKLTNKFHGVVAPAYYQKALAYLAKKVGQKDFKLFVFSNDIRWCKENLKFDYPTIFIDGNNPGAEDMRLMKHCKHHVLANSSFSWWGAWLNQNPDKVVIAPKVWFQDKQANRETDIVPSDWIRI
ncbi:MAG TPA: alpha-1,2-fucosyltransferase [Candidatus Nitrosopolaris sp.]|nr:alpha-1,2-fucosyltransferase [Candidatus Nitrosopolaris sp.]